MQLECLAGYMAELSLLEYSMLCHAPSIVAASSIFLAKYILVPSKRPWVRISRNHFLVIPSSFILIDSDARLILSLFVTIFQNSTLQHYTHYQPSDLRECVKDLHRLCLNSHSSNLPAVREKYSQHKVMNYNFSSGHISRSYNYCCWIRIVILVLIDGFGL